MAEQDPLKRVESAAQKLAAVHEEVGKLVVGQRDILEGALTCLVTGGHALLEGVPGLGKTLLVRALSQAVALKFTRIQFTPDLVPSDHHRHHRDRRG